MFKVIDHGSGTFTRSSVAYNTGVKDVSKINDFYVKVSESMEKDGPVSLQESERKTHERRENICKS